MACSSDVVKKVLRFKLQLSGTDEAATVLKILQKLKDLDITLDILAETGIGKTVNSLRRHELAGELAKSLVRGWKKLVPKESTSHTEDGDVTENVSFKDKLDNQNSPSNKTLAADDISNHCLHDESQDTSDEFPMKRQKRKKDSVSDICENGQQDKNQKENQQIWENDLLNKTNKIHEDKRDHLKKKKSDRHQKTRDDDDDDVIRSKKSEEIFQKSKPNTMEKLKRFSDHGNFGPEKELDKKLKSSKQSGDKSSKISENVKDGRSSGISQAQNRKRKKSDAEKDVGIKFKESENTGNSATKNKEAKIKQKDRESHSDPEEPTMSFESYLSYDLNSLKRKEGSGTKKRLRIVKTVVKGESAKDPEVKPVKSQIMSVNVISPKKRFKESVKDPLNLPENENPPSVEYFERKVEKEPDFCDDFEESAIFTGQRLNKKMQVYSGAKTVFLPTMMSLYQQCIRTLQNNLNLLHETGGVPFEILEPVLERCTPEQLLHIEECNPIYIGVTDHLWGKHCQRDFKDSKLQEYESWKEMYIRLSEERERKLQQLTKSIVSAQSMKPKGRQVKMAFIHTVAKPPRDVRIQQEIHGTAVPQPHQLRCSVKLPDSRSRPMSAEPTRSSSTSPGTSNSQDPRKKTRVAPMMAKSLKAFKKQLGRR
ncbi:elongin A, like [Sphaeramia orbicularis]|uniref:elongin A, like n=1 Tax=Sphaeramia orbicularis TaxID=375764 RepID=UPI00117D392D|nr:elongin-A-like [Sphaeramia orbicularis]